MVKLFKRTLSLISSRQNSILSAASVIMMAVALSRFLGLIRDWILVTKFTPKLLGVYIAAFRIPNMIFELLVMGALTSAFIPVFTTYLDTKGKDVAFKMASSVINIGLFIFVILTIFMLLFTKEISQILAPGFTPQEIELMVSFTRIIMIAQVFPLIIGTFFTGILQSFNNFLLPALAPVIYNIGIILGIVFLSPFVGLYGPVWGVVIGAILFAAIQAPLVFSLGYKPQLNFDIKHPGTREIGKLMLPRTIGLAVSQIDTTFDLILSTLLGGVAVTVFNFAQHLQQVPIGLFGASIAQATLPTLSSTFAQKKIEEFKKVFFAAFHQILFFIVPLSSILIVLRLPIVRLVFGIKSLLDLPTTLEISQTLAIFSISLFAQALVQLIARGFYALHDSKTPVIIGAIGVGGNTVLSILFVVFYHLGVWSLALSTSIASIFHLLLLLFFFHKKVNLFDRLELFLPTIKIFLSGMVTGVTLYIPIKLFDQLVFDTTRTINLIMLTSVSTIMGLSVYFFLAWFLEVPEMDIIFKLFQKAKNIRRGAILDTTTEIENVQGTKI
ncbi:murein biosynthesis integral membrane protein MurJ [Candidatus Gottesmanbacteria bacterium]|nr:murein biosynthesis integral membrane protein MurJ [Candidatus Gottesmanbacteria bacterium]